MTRKVRWTWAALAGSLLTLHSMPGWAQDDGEEAEGLAAEEGVKPTRAARLDAVQSRVFEKTGRFEIYPHLYGIVLSNNSLWRHETLSGLNVAYHFSEGLHVEGVLALYPDLRGLGYDEIKTLVYQIAIAHGIPGELPVVVPKEQAFIGGSVNISPIYGKLNLVGSHVQNFDMSFLAGAGLLVMRKVQYDYDFDDETGIPYFTEVTGPGGSTTAALPALDLGFTARFFLTRALTLRADLRMHGYIDQVSVTGSDAQEGVGSTEQYQNAFRQSFALVAGLSYFLP